MNKIVIIGATSAIANETAKLFALKKASLFLVARNPDKLSIVANDLKVRGASKVATLITDLNNLDDHEKIIRQANFELGGIDIVLIAHGSLSNQKQCEKSVSETLNEFKTNCFSVISLATLFANQFEKEKNGTLAVISSVAGDKARQSNYVYGTAKAAVSAFLQGLRNRLHRSNVHVLTIKPGFVDTPMTQDLKKNFLFAKPQTVAKGIIKAIQKKKDIVYLPFFWRWILLFVKLLPERIFKRLSL